ncbi:hydroxyethylthiazole kinase [Fredinandcohnia quinoae]|uniref:Hydroxyethylthiazole kinase n=1 Tax=Fredinandcohnia quinoae TaxID=2918902 RepID=A0AAW5EAU6_9BACI|nr:hydroxyethylthiazole kinase [Fredinandcohnia sp. SECRCQ15]MCH1627007.1 hydroxyethylthiazole kinase [Fredinandcohnia sp. SECRCQ15]
MFEKVFENIDRTIPLVHNITNYVTVNDVANMILACGGSPIMADDMAEVEEITSICNSLVINIGTLNDRTIHSMILAGKKANELGNPVILDPVGAGASKLRTNTVYELLNEVKFTVIRGNISEIKTVYAGSGSTQGVDASIEDLVTNHNLDEMIELAQRLSRRTGAVIAITGEIDIVADEKKVYMIRNGHEIMSKITGTGCMLTAVIGAYCGANKGDTLDSTAAAVSAMGLCGELAYEKLLKTNGGTSSFRTFLIDYMSVMNHSLLEKGSKIETR